MKVIADTTQARMKEEMRLFKGYKNPEPIDDQESDELKLLQQYELILWNPEIKIN
jgi:hypothetical protein